jgi:hypothetical protein
MTFKQFLYDAEIPNFGKNLSYLVISDGLCKGLEVLHGKAPQMRHTLLLAAFFSVRSENRNKYAYFLIPFLAR